MKLIALIAALAFAACTSAAPPCPAAPPPPPCPANTPADLAPAPDSELAFVLDAQGVQRYACTASGWSAAIPAAALFAGGRKVVEHFAGPTWMSTIDSSSVVATKHAASTIDAGSIPWLLLDVTAHGGGKGVMTAVTQIQRLTTAGGATPASGCDAAHVGLEVDVGYTASYWFYRAATPGAAHQRCGA